MKMSSILSTIILEHGRYQKSTGSEEDLRIAHVLTEIERNRSSHQLRNVLWRVFRLGERKQSRRG